MLDIGLLATVRKTLRQSNGRKFRKLPFYHGKKKFLNVPMERIVAQVKKEGKRKF